MVITTGNRPVVMQVTVITILLLVTVAAMLSKSLAQYA